MSRYEDNSSKYDEAEANLKPIVDRLEAECGAFMRDGA